MTENIRSIAIPDGLHPDTAKLVCDFAEAVAEKLRRAEVKYGYLDAWKLDHWRDGCAAELLRHVHKGDPRDVAAYCAFAWFHGWSVTPAAQGSADALIETGKMMAHTWSNTKWPGGMIASLDEFWDSLEEGHRAAWLAAARVAGG